MIQQQSIKKGVILAGGYGSRLYPVTRGVSKHLLAVYNKPMIYYPLTTLMLAGMQEILVIVHPEDLPHYQSILRDGHQWGVDISLEVQDKPASISENLLLAEDFLQEDPFCLLLGDNFFYHRQLRALIKTVLAKHSIATVITQLVAAGDRFAVMTGFYCYSYAVIELVKQLSIEEQELFNITDINNLLFERRELKFFSLPGDVLWFDMGTPDSLLLAAQAVQELEKAQSMVGSPTATAWHLGYINAEQVCAEATRYHGSEHARALNRLVKS